ncbi:MAG: SRPBCC family protein [Chitinophagales bacterium]|nr:SRPBCC family protein [Chitinophagales bacterium]
MDNKTPITVQALVNAPLEKAWACWTDPAHITQWNHASDDWHCPKATNDPRTCGKFSATMAARDGSMSFDFEGTYDEVIPMEKLSYQMPDGRKVLVTFAEEGSGTVVTETFDPEDMNPLEMQRAGWQAILDNYKKHTESV